MTDYRHIHFFGPGVVEEPGPKEILGGKGHSLAVMSRAALPVPPGFTISAACCPIYHETGRKWPPGLEEEVRRALSWLEETTDRTFGRGPKPLLVAVRSGAAVSMPGMMDTVLNVGLHPGLAGAVPGFEGQYEDFKKSYLEIVGREAPVEPWEMLAGAVSAVFESWNNERAVTYRARHDIRGVMGTAVTVQAMFPSHRSGIMFTEDPNRPDQGRIVIEASEGLGEAIVRGQVEPDAFTVDRATMAISERKGSCVTDEQVVEVARLGLKVEAHYGTPVDVEWALADGRLVLLQSRPVRGLDVARAVARVRQEEIERLRKLAGGRRRAWAAHNLSETLPAPTPLTWDIIGVGFMSDGFLRMYREVGFTPSAQARRDGFLELVAGRVYADLDRAAELFFDTFPMEYDVSSGRGAEMLLDRPTKFRVDRAGAGFLLRLPYYIFCMLRAGRALRRLVKKGLPDVTAEFLEFASGRPKPSTLGDGEVLGELVTRERALNRYGAEFLKPAFLAAVHHGRAVATLEQALGPEEGRAMAGRLLAGLEGDKTVEANIALHKGDLEAFLAEYGHRAVAEFELAEPRWREDSTYPRQRIAQYRRAAGPSPGDLHQLRCRERADAERALPGRLAEAGASSLEADLLGDLKGAQRYLPFRETCKHQFMRAVAMVREAIEALAERWNLGRDIYYLRRSELPRFLSDRDALVAEIGRRKVRWQAFQRIPLPEIVLSDDLEAIGRETPRREGDSFDGTGVSAGVGTGPARIVRSPDQAGDLGVGYVLVCPTTDPGWTPLFVHAAGLVVERGGVLSHGAIVARDFGIPAVVLRDATRLLGEGVPVRVDGTRGRVERVK